MELIQVAGGWSSMFLVAAAAAAAASCFHVPPPTWYLYCLKCDEVNEVNNNRKHWKNWIYWTWKIKIHGTNLLRVCRIWNLFIYSISTLSFPECLWYYQLFVWHIQSIPVLVQHFCSAGWQSTNHRVDWYFSHFFTFNEIVLPHLCNQENSCIVSISSEEVQWIVTRCRARLIFFFFYFSWSKTRYLLISMALLVSQKANVAKFQLLRKRINPLPTAAGDLNGKQEPEYSI